MSNTNKPKKPGLRRGLVFALAGAAFVVVLGGLYGMGYAIAGDTVPRGTSVAGIDLTGLTPEQAEQKLVAELNPKLTQSIKVVAASRQVDIAPDAAGLKPDYEATVNQATRRSANPLVIWKVLFGGGKLDLVVHNDDAALAKAVEDAAQTLNSVATSATIAYKGTQVVIEPAVDGVQVDVAKTAAAVKEAWLKAESKVEAVAQVQAPEITTETVEDVAASYARPAVASPIIAKTEKGLLTFSPEMIAKATTFTVEGSKVVAKTSAKALLDAIKPQIDKLKLPKPKDATFTFRSRPVVVAAVDGLSIDEKTIEQTILPIVAKSGDRETELAFVKESPTFTTEDANKLGVKEVIGEFTTYFPDTAYRNNNLPRATRALNGTLLKPGEVFSFNQVVGQRTTARGYMAGGAICPGNKMCKQLGGGVSQVATTTYNAFFFSGLQHLRHQPHTLYFSRYPAGRESTIDWGHIDVSFKNDSKYGVYVQGIGIPGSNGRSGVVRIRIWSTKEYTVKSSPLYKYNFTKYKTEHSDKPDCKKATGKGGFDVSYKRLWYKNGKLVKSEPFFWRYTTATEVICDKPKDKKKDQ